LEIGSNVLEIFHRANRHRGVPRTGDLGLVVCGDKSGGWSGSGSMKPSNGDWEKVRCKVAYNVTKPGKAISLDLRCASDAYKMSLSANIEQNETQLSGNWFESEYRQGGKISGTNSDGLIEARIEGETVAALVTIRTKGGHQSFVMEAPGSWLSQVTIELNKDAK